MTQTERRHYFRINDTVGLSYRLKNDAQSEALQTDNLVITNDHLLQHINEELNRMTNALWQELPVAAEALGLLNKKLDIIANSTGQINREEIFLKDTDVSISACGIAFLTEDKLAEGALLEISLGLKPSNIQLSFEGKLISCEPLSSKGNLARVEFINVAPLIEEQLIQHIVQRQAAQLSEQKTG